MQKKMLVLYNPLSNEGRAKSMWEKLEKVYPFLTESAFAITEISDVTTFLKTQKPEMIVVAGGDGTINSVGKAVLELTKKPTLSILPLGFGNALSYCFGVETIEKALAVITNPQDSIAIDVMKTNLAAIPIGFFNIGTGFDARIVHDFNTRRYIGIRSYLLSTFQSYIFHAPSEITFTIDHKVTLSARASSLMVANGPSIGHNALVAPEAKLNDGFLDCTLFSTKYAYLTNLRLRGFKHPLYSRSGKVHFKATHIKIEGEPYVQIDGEPVEEPNSLEISILKKKISFFYNKEVLFDKDRLTFFPT